MNEGTSLPGDSGSLFDVCALEEQDRAVLERLMGMLHELPRREKEAVLAGASFANEVDRLREALQKIGEFAASHSGSDGQDVLLAALYLIAEKCEAML